MFLCIKPEKLYKYDTTSYEGAKVDALTSQFGLQQIDKEPTHILAESSSCINLVIWSSLVPLSKLSLSNSICTIIFINSLPYEHEI